MGCCFSTENQTDDASNGPSSRSSLLSGPQKKYVEEMDTNSVTVTSARQHHPLASQGRESDLQVMQMKPISISHLNKTFQDQAALFNDVLLSYNNMLDDMQSFKRIFVAETAGIPTLSKCIQILVDRCGQTQLSLKRRKHGVEIDFSERTLMTSSIFEPSTVISTLKLFNSLNKHLEKVLDKNKPLTDSVDILLSSEHDLRSEVTKSDLTTSEGAEAMHHLMENIKHLKQIRTNLNIMKTKCDEEFKIILESSKGFCKD